MTHFFFTALQQMRILFLHGLESGPRGMKSRQMSRLGHEVEAVQMPCGRRAVLTDPLLLAAVLVAVMALVLLSFWERVALIVGMAVFRRSIMAALVNRMLAKSVQAQLDFLPSVKSIDVVVGSSWGGAVAFELMKRRVVDCPVLLLAPAVHKVAAKRRAVLPSTIDYPHRVVIVHGTRDATVPPEDSRKLQQLLPKASLHEVDDDHRLNATVKSQLRALLDECRR